jgi:hypothetical protein
MAKLDNILKSKEIFKVPENYFENLSSEIETTISEEFIKEKVGNKNPFNVPDGYFENFIINPESKQTHKIIKILKPYLSIAAGIIIFAGIFTVSVKLLNKKEITNILQDSLQKTGNQFSENVIDLTKIDKKEIDERADIFLYEMDSETIINLSETSEHISNSTSDDESVYDYFVDYDSGMDYIDYIAEN